LKLNNSLHRRFTAKVSIVILIVCVITTVKAMGQFFPSRQLLILKNEANQHLAKQQLDLLQKAEPGVKERDIKITVADREDALYKKYIADTSGFTVLLIGKDGSEKHRTNKLLTVDELFAIIDAMPMRKREMKKN
jgi:hypothetical protein